MRSDIGNSKNGYQVRKYNDSVKRYCQTLDLKDNPELIEEYVNRHSKLNSWPEIRAGIREVGILEMEIYIYNSRLFMIVETPLDFDWDTAMEKLAHLPRQAECQIPVYNQCYRPNGKNVCLYFRSLSRGQVLQRSGL